ncbi:hypothetical protein Tdes44962_MAKER01649 [Teratosphaeria destructans]|uniref:DUF7707 domain-containing protein n=1 Tax=Teratosphaeria destructans TaxID=418781 RepID=A0A9W7SXZ7_9PEZI|nr:hypothetical protein Tdes44962_MAKER01649 [Teratosphaeria destructans]
MKFSPRTAALAACLLSTANAYHPIDPNSVSLTTRKSWCDSQVTQCPYLCSQYDVGQEAQTNNCNPDTLTYTCVCKNNIVPSASEFTLTLDYFVCQTWGQQCKEACNSVEACNVKCVEDMKCGAQNPRGANQSRPMNSATSAAAAVVSSAAAATTPGSAGATPHSGVAHASGNGTRSSSGSGSATATGSHNATSTGSAARVQLGVDAFVGQTLGVVGLAGAFVAGFALLL